MIPHNFWKLSALALTLIAPAAMADWRSDGNIKRNKVSANDSSDDSSRDDSQDAPQEEAEESRAHEEAKGFSLGLRAGVGLPFGKTTGEGRGDSGKLSNTFSALIPLQLDVGYFINSHLYVGGSFQYGLGLLAEDCGEGASCSASVMRFGANVDYHFAPLAKVDPWVGLGIGYELLSFSASATLGGQKFESSSSGGGFEFAALQGGIGFQLNKNFTVGPFVTFTVGQYSSFSLSDGEDSVSEDIEKKSIHSWLMGGVRAQYRF
ncbi:hypothetical protein POL68_22430 [Stigmatella sp. ncwal1]|uniref:Outer membrane protein beta-barrel domain-containing protein n=1 Tax=Stigmatella ashevillensis TaxID=2995309 RepID=A0ABT5DCA4_9BACT|nr:hypothetical protein [Stigmatella ashevillena]MDC0711244.1 hypothetical protein [Stigmatella ashevillena]